MRFTRGTALLLLAGLALVVAGGCGSSCDPCPPSDAGVLAGTFHVAGRAGLAGPPHEDGALWGTMTFTADGRVLLEADANELGSIGEFPGVGELLYDVGLHRTITTGLDEFQGLTFLAGGYSEDGSLVTLATEGAGRPQLLLMTRRTSTSTPESLAGDYHLCGIRYELALSVHTGWLGTLTLDGSGGGTLAGFQNRDGTTGVLGATGVTTSVAGDGTMVMGLGSTGTVAGAISQGGDVMILSGSTTSLGDPALHVIVRHAESASADDLHGFYHLIGFEVDAGSGDHSVLHGTAYAESSTQALGMQAWRHVESSAEEARFNGTYTVGANGAVILQSTGGGDELRGAVSASGRVAILWRGGDPGSDPSLWVLIR